MKQDMNDTFRIAFRAMVVAAMTLLTVSTAMAQVKVYGNVYGGGNLADVKENAAVNMSAGHVYGNVFGGGKGESSLFTCEKAMVGVEGSGAGADLTTAENRDKGTIVTISNGTVGTLEGEEGSQTLKEGTGNVYGGGEIGRVEWNTQVKIGVGTGEGTFAPVIYGSVFGAGKGLATHGYSALVRGNSTVTIQGGAQVGYNVYGGGEMSTVGRYWVKGINNNVDGAPKAPEDLPVGMPYQQQSGGICSVTIQGSAIIGSLGIDDKGHVFGAGKGVEPHFVASGKGASQKMVKGDSENPDRLVNFTNNETTGQTAEEAYLEFLQTLSLVTNSYVTIDGSAQVIGSVFGGSESGFVQHDTNVAIKGSCEIGTDKYGNIFGGGKGLEDFAEAGKVKGNTKVTISSGTVKGNVYGGGRLGDVGLITKPADYNYTWKQSDGSTANAGENNKITGTNNNTGICTVNVSGGAIGTSGTVSAEHGNVYGAGRGTGITWWCEKAIAYATNVSVSGGTVNGNIYGGGQVGRVEDDAKVTIGTPNETGESKPTIIGSVYGAGAGLATHGYSALVRGNAEVTVQGTAQVGGSVYGGGETASVGKFEVVGGLPTKPKTGGTCIVNIKDNAKIGESGTGHNVYGACKGVEPTYVASGENRSKSMQLLTNAPSDNNLWSYYEGDETSPFIWRYYATKQDYLDFLKTLALTSHPHVTIGGTWTPNETTGTITASGSPTVYGSVYGGGQRGVTLGNVDVNMVGGTVEQDVYGGGALADTNLGNWDVNVYEETTAPNEGEDLYTRTGEEGNYIYTKVTDISATSGPYYRQVPTWAHTEGSAYYTTTVDLTGGTIKGDAYGGGLGQRAREAAEGVTALDDVPAYVFGDVTVKLNEGVATDAKGAIVNRVFAANNLNGSPQGNTSVYVYATQSADAGHATIGSKFDKHTGLEAEGAASTYDVQAVYGGGNEASYLPKSPYTAENTTGAKSQVIIEGCDLTSIKTVYGGGNAASVPETNVTVKSVYEIEDLFGGGNGKDDTSYGKNPGADIGVYKNASNSDVLYGTGNVNVTTQGGYIHELFGASNQKGSIKGDVALNMTQVGTCTLKIDKVYNAGRNADIEGNLISVLSCQPATKILEYYGGAENANVKGNVELTITNGWFEKVFAGNNQSGSIFGHIKLNVEETGCSPIRIDELYGCGNDAAYSVYGYYVQTEETENGTGLGNVGEHPLLNNEKLVLLPRTSADDPHKPVKTFNHETQEWTVYAGDNSDPYPRYDDPEVNIVSATYIGKVFGGGYGANGTVYGNPQVFINMIPGEYAAQIDRDGIEGVDNDANALGEIGTVYGGGNEADVVGNTFVNIGTKDKVSLHLNYDKTSSEYEMSDEKTVEGAYITGNVYGGGKGEAKMEAGTAGEAFLCAKAMVKGDDGTHVNIGNGLVTGSVYGGGEKGRVEHNTEVKIGLDEADVPTGKTSAPIINGNVFGAGKGVNTHGYSALVRGTSTVTVQADAKVRGNVYGGGEMASVGKYKVENGLPVALAPDNIHPNSGYCYVNIRGNAEIGPDDMEMTKEGGPSDAGHVFGAGKGVLPYENADEEPFHMNGTQVLDENNEWDGKSWEDHPTTYPAYNSNAELDDDYVKFIKSLALATQTVVAIEGNPFIKGSVYGGSENGFVQQDTHVTISGGQIGNGYVQMDDNGNYLPDPLSVNRRYTTDEWSQGKLIMGSNDRQALKDLVSTTNYTSSLPECASWRFGAPYAPYDVFADASGNYPSGSAFATAEGGRPTGSDGHTFFGNVFGGGSGYYPYKAGRWFKDAGAVYGDTYVTIKGGHILTSVYGGNEMTDVGKYDDSDRLKLLSGGNCYVTMIGGTLGVPRTLGQIDKHPVTCYLFGAGKGDQRVFFNKSTNVGNVFVHISDDARIYGSIFGGGEDGHVMKNVTMNIGGSTLPTAVSGNSVLSSIFEELSGSKTVGEVDYPYIGTWGTSYVDGNVFGAGRGFGGDAYTAGNVAGTVTMNIYGGTMLGSVYGGGRLGSVGYGLFDAKTSTGGDMPGYGEMRPDNTTETESGNSESLDSFNRGHVDITINGGTIGNKWEFVDVDPSTTPANLATWKTNHNVPNTEYEEPKVVTTDNKTLYYYQLKHTKGGNVFAGGMGRQKQIDGQTLIDPEKIDWKKLGNVKQTTLTITGGKIMSNVYGGGELGAVVPYVNGNTVEGGTTQINISGTAVIGTLIERSVTTTGEGGSDVTTKVPVYTFGSVFGGGMGNETDKTSSDDEARIGGLVKGSTTITMSAGEVKGSVYGGGEMAVVQGNHTTTDSKTVGTEVSISGGTIGYNQDGFGGATMGNVYGGGKGSLNTANAGLIKNNTLVKITGTPTIYHNIYGGGAYGSVGTFTFTTGVPENWTDGTGKAEVIVEGGTIGINGHENGMVFGSSRGDVAAPTGSPAVDPNDRLAWVYDTHVTIGSLAEGTEGQEGYVPATAPQINGSVYGSGENGHTFNDTEVIIHSGTVGIEDGWPINGLSGAYYPTRGNVYGGGCGTDTYDVTTGTGDNAVTKTYFNRLSGIVQGNTSVTMDGGHVVRSIYGGGAMGSVGVFERSTTDATDNLPGSITRISSGGKCSVSISGGKVGPATLTMPMNAGMVFGAGRGEVHDVAVYPNLERVVYVNETDVTISGTAFVKGSVYGGAESGHVFGDTHVTIDGDCQIGCGYDGSTGGSGDLNRVYTADEWAYDVTSDNTKFLYECNSWPFTEPYTPYDKFADKDGKYPNGESADNAHQKGTDGHTFYGNVFGGGSGYEPYDPGKWLPTAGWVQGNTVVEIKGGHILTSVYGGNEMSDVGSGGVQKMTDLTNVTSDMFYDITKPGGKCTVKMSGGTLGVPRTLDQIAAHPLTCYLFGAGKGDQRIFFNKTTNVKEVEIEISGGRIYGSVFGGGEDGHVMRDVKMTIKDGSTTTGEGEQAVTTTTSPIIGTWGTSYVDGNVFGGGRGFSGEALTAGNVGGSVNIDIQGGKMLGNIYGGGRLGSVGYGLYLVDEEINGVKPYGVLRGDNVDDRGNSVDDFKRGYITINISGGTIGNDIEYKYNPTDADKQKMPSTQFDYQNHLTYTRGGNVFTGCMGRLYALDNRTLLPLWTKLGRCRQTILNITGGTIKSNVYGGAELGVVQEDATVNITGGTVGTKVGEGENAYYYGSVFGSGKGSNDAITYPEGTAEADKTDISEAGTVEGNVKVELNKGVAESENKKGGVVHKIFGCNDMNGTPKGTVTVHVHATQKEGGATINDKAAKAATAEDGTYDVEAVYGGGNLAAYVPAKAVSGSDAEKELARPEVIIDGCGLTSIGTVYGGGNAASVPATNVTVNGTYEIGQVFGGGNGKDKLPSGSDNPGANVGYYSYPNATNAAYDTKENRIANYGYGSGKAHATIYGGTVHVVYGGSNKKGNVRVESRTTLEDGVCPLNVGASYGGGNDAPMDGSSVLEVGCISGMEKAYGGAANADVNGNVELNITNGTYGRVFGGNDQGGAIRGSITVNIEETGCRPIVIGELYGGGNEAAYSVYGYDADGKPLKKGDPGALDVPNANPTVNVKSFTSIGTIYGGGYGTPATMVGSPIVNINVHEGKYYNTFRGNDNVIDSNAKVVGTSVKYPADEYPGYDNGYPIPSHDKGKIGAINDVFGGGNAAAVIGNPTVNIGTEAGEEVYVEVEVNAGDDVTDLYLRTGAGTTEDPYAYTSATGTAVTGTTFYLKTTKAVDIRGNVYGGGNNADVQGDTNVVIGKKAE